MPAPLPRRGHTRALTHLTRCATLYKYKGYKTASPKNGKNCQKGGCEEMNSISVHAISMLYELRVLRSRLEDMIDQPALVVDIDRLVAMWNIVELLIRKTERTGEFIAALQAQVNECEEEAQAGVGPGLHDRDGDR